MVDHAQQLADRIWQRYDRKQRLIRYAVLLATLMLVVWAVRDIDIFWPWVWDAPNQISGLGARMWPPSAAGLNGIIAALIETVHIATLATFLTIFLALPVATSPPRILPPTAPVCGLVASFWSQAVR